MGWGNGGMGGGGRSDEGGESEGWVVVETRVVATGERGQQWSRGGMRKEGKKEREKSNREQRGPGIHPDMPMPCTTAHSAHSLQCAVV